MTGDVDADDGRESDDGATASAIRQLDDQTVERIAAGEVVERPASVVKELVENSLDADASRVSVAVEAGGTEGIRITDDGVGMSREAVETAVEKHTTSKISDIADLEAGVATLGFRGEALHAIGAVSRVTITTRPRGEDTGTELVLEGGEVTSVGPAGCPEGTTIEVADLFYNVPARRKYLKQASTEFAHVNTVVTSYALANPAVAVSLEHDGRETFATTGQGDLQETVMSVYGREVARSMIAVESDDSDLPEGPLDGVSGLVSHPETNRAGREYLSTYVNGRYVRANAVREAVVDAYGTQLAPDRYPFAVLFLDVDPGTVDVNVHPRKMEIRFADEAGMREQVVSAVEGALLREGLIRSGAPRGRSAPDQTEIAPERSEDGSEADGDGADDRGSSDRGDSRRLSIDAADVKEGQNAGASERERPSRPTGDDTPQPPTADADGGTDASVSSSSTGPEPSTPTDAGSGTTSSDTDLSSDTDPSSDAGRSSDTDRSSDPVRPSDPSRKFTGGRQQRRLGGEEPTESFDTLPSMRILGQLHETYVVAETDDGLVLVDQHAADERINYERLKEAFRGETTTQALADPVELELTAREAELFADRGEALSRLGFHANRVDDRTVEVTTVPGVVADGAGPELVRDALSAFVSGEDAAAETVEAAADELLGDLACYPSITGNTSLTEGSIRELLAALDECENPYACPHGRPVVIELDRGELEDRFERDYPGHSGRRE
ncbi:DNA mismatch repair protein MutL [Halomicrobium zhouii]|uniref:DNA mismatch repair protein MutL n=1 Tax=Halomicrobium zhouii TaxID=767519 RepID=A0A1I6L3P5_9EURY|nr:DNA mismatch repair endonuclease MutL [Halomicrobium zhouii]SFR97880.1 DNA mismatch repair protein MutL [Halomicrobium zhouii]